MVFATNIEVKTLMMTIMKVGELKKMMSGVKMETVGYDYAGKEEFSWPCIYRTHVEF